MGWTEEVRLKMNEFYGLLYSYRYEFILILIIVASIILFMCIYIRVVGNVQDKKITLDTNDWWNWEKYYEEKKEKKESHK